MNFDNTLDLSRLQFAMTAVFHILWPVLTISLALFVFILEALWIRTGELAYYQHVRFWAKLLALNFGVGVVSGIPLEFQFGTNWAPFSKFTGEFIGNILGFEGAMAFMLEAGFIGIMLFGWGRVSRGAHLFSTGMVALGSSISAFWIMVANSWMQTPSGIDVVAGKVIVRDYAAAIFNPSMPASVSHMWFASVETGLFVVAGLSAWKMLRGQQPEFFSKSFKIALAMCGVVAPIQLVLGDASGQAVFKHQPAKGAAIEGHWMTNAIGDGASWSLIAWPNQATQQNDWSLEVPYALSLLGTHSLTGRVQGLRDFATEDQPPGLPLLYYAFRIMAGIGFWLALLTAWTAWAWWQERSKTVALTARRWLLRAWVLTIPLPYVAVEAGWIIREVGRQPWVVYGLLRTRDAASVEAPAALLGSIGMFTLFYAALFGAFAFFARRWFSAGADLNAQPPSRLLPSAAPVARTS